MVKQATLLLVVLSLWAAVIVSGCGKAPAAVEPNRPAVSGIELGTVQSREVEAPHETVGTVKAGTVSVLSSKFMGTVLAVYVRQGEAVHAGQLLLEIEARDVAAQASAAAAQRNLAQATFERYRRLAESGAISRQDFDAALAQKNIAEAEYERAAATLAFSRVTAPIDGVVSDRRVDPGTMVSPGQTLLAVDDPSTFVVETNLEERWASRLSIGAPVMIRLPSTENSSSGKVLEISPSVDSASRTFYVKVSALGPRLRSGLFARVSFPGIQERLQLIPTKALIRKGQLDGVYAVSSDGVVAFRPVKSGRVFGGDTEILSGLGDGEKIVVGGLEKAIDGGKLTETKQP
jgi:RND family efflux transporter MFP subunit